MLALRSKRALMAPILLTVAAGAALTACGSEGEEKDSVAAVDSSDFPEYEGLDKGLPTSYGIPEPKGGQDLTFGYLNISSGNELLNALDDGFAAMAEHLGVKSVTLVSGISVDKQVSDFEQLLAQGVDGIFVNPLDSRALSPVLEQAKAQGVPVIGVDITLDDSPLPDGYVSQVWRGMDSTAYQQVKSVAEAQPGAKFGTIDVVVPVPGPLYLIERVKYWAPKFGLTFLGAQKNPTDDAAGGQQAATPLLNKYPDLNAILGYNDASVVGAVAAARTLGREIVTVGASGTSDGIEGVRNGRLTATIQINAPMIGAQALAGLYNVVTGQNLPLPKTILVKGTVVTPESLDSLSSFDEAADAIAEDGLPDAP